MAGQPDRAFLFQFTHHQRVQSSSARFASFLLMPMILTKCSMISDYQSALVTLGSYNAVAGRMRRSWCATLPDASR